MHRLFVLACLLSVAVAMTTHGHGHHHTGPTHHPINEAFSFHYDAHSHTMAVKTHRHCYLYALSSAEQTSVHSSTGLHSIEKTMIDLIDAHGNHVAVSTSDLTAMGHGLAHFCDKLAALRIN
uniref:Uncharacterized protein LOC111122572 n=1 Tax=Crassostrea virginica TaxID=6565 RepID=A0A8B8CWQ8_CRAVI|nr:uncharacterized protein LOC111122572 [Crassostrea virginica]